MTVNGTEKKKVHSLFFVTVSSTEEVIFVFLFFFNVDVLSCFMCSFFCFLLNKLNVLPPSYFFHHFFFVQSLLYCVSIFNFIEASGDIVSTSSHFSVESRDNRA